MIVDNIVTIDCYKGLGSRFEMAFDFIRKIYASKEKYEVGRYEIDGKNIYAVVQEYITKSPEEKDLEAHRKYIDIQFMLKGRECIFYSPLDLTASKTSYSVENDYELFTGKSMELLFREGDFAVFYPQDAHKPGCTIDQPEQVIKVVVKILLY